MRRPGQQYVTEAVDGIIRLIDERFPAGDAEQLRGLTRGYFEDIVFDEIEEQSVENMFGAVASLWQFSRNRKPLTPKIRAYNPRLEEHGWQTTHTAIEVVNDDMPFLVDSVVSALNLMQLTVHMLIHPIIRVARDDSGTSQNMRPITATLDGSTPESFLHVEVTQQPTPEALAAIEKRLAEVLASVRAAVEDWRAMMACLDEALAEIETASPPIDKDALEEGKAFLEWLRDDQFTFLGYREYVYERKEGRVYASIAGQAGLGVLREVAQESSERHQEPLPESYAAYIDRKALFIISKSWNRSDVHRPVYMDYIGVRRFNEAGEVVGERRFLGLLTSGAYNKSPRNIPLLRQKVNAIIERSGYGANSHNGKALMNILETFPRDELFQIEPDTLEIFVHGILQLEHRQRIRLFMRQDSYAEFYSCLVYVPRDRYDTALRQRIEDVLLDVLNGRSVEVSTQFSEAPMARAHFIVHTPGGGEPNETVDEIERRLIMASRRWDDDLHDALIEVFGEARGAMLYHEYTGGIPASYKEAFSARLAVADIERMEGMADGGIAMNLYRRVDAPDGMLNFKIYRAGDPVPLSSILPMLEHMGFIVMEEAPFEIQTADGEQSIWIHDFHVRVEYDWDVDVSEARGRFHDTFARVWSGEVEDDNFNDLVLAGFAWREIVVLRAYAKYMNQANVPFSQSYIERTLAANPVLARHLVDLFLIKFDADNRTDVETRMAQMVEHIEADLDAVAVLDQDRIIRKYLNLIQSTLRTNYFQADADGKPKPYVSFKLDSAAIDDLPEPRPWREIFVYSSDVEAVHLRGGPVARGGIRWSDRSEDFRTEVLGLVKAQQVKNAVIVPLGAKGGFVVKKPPKEGGREAQLAAGIACYKIFMSGMLDITDNLVGTDVVQRKYVVRYDDDDPYLVVAADKGTATFSDIANEVAEFYGHWLGDAFASGGSAGYDHKGMAITARGAWVAVQRHFRELGKDIQKEPFTVVGIGDMSGDVFGNGMLLSEHIKLVGAFNHMHIFVDPDPDPATSFAERRRMFELPRSSWTDYDSAILSKGGGIYERSAKSIELTPEVRECFGIKQAQVTPNELVRSMLCAQIDLFWNGGIGTYIKASDETHAEVGDRANDAVRRDGRDVKFKVIGEGGNLGVTQRGRIEYALAGGKINTDAIDNSAGVDCSDHEVNIKVLLGDVVGTGDMTVKQRNTLLAEMTDEVAELVLRDNYLQTQALTTLEHLASKWPDEQVRFMLTLSSHGLLDRRLEYLPDDEELADWKSKGRHFTRPELAVLFAYAKMDLYSKLLQSDLPDDDYLSADLVRYFPKPLQERFADRMMSHRLRREIVATSVTNSMINRTGMSFVNRVSEESGMPPADVARAYAVVREAFSLRDIWVAIEALDNKVPSQCQTAMMLEAIVLIERVTPWFLHNTKARLDIEQTIGAFKPAIAALSEKLMSLVSKGRKASIERAARRFTKDGVPKETALTVARLRTLGSVCDVVWTATQMNLDVIDVGTVFFDVGEELGSDWLRDNVGRLAIEDRWDRLASQALIEDSFNQQRALTARVLEAGNGVKADKAVDAWVSDNREMVDRSLGVLGDLKGAGPIDLAMLNVASRSFKMLTGE